MMRRVYAAMVVATVRTVDSSPFHAKELKMANGEQPIVD